MATEYVTDDGDMLDDICWRHYGQRSRLREAALSMDPRLVQASRGLEEGILSLVQYGPQSLDRVVERVLEHNHGLASRGVVLPAGVRIHLPDLPDDADGEGESVKLWDD